MTAAVKVYCEHLADDNAVAGSEADLGSLPDLHGEQCLQVSSKARDPIRKSGRASVCCNPSLGSA